MTIEAGPYYKLTDVHGLEHFVKFSTVRNTWFTDNHVIFELDNDHVTITRAEHERLKSVLNHTKRPNGQ